MVVIAAAAVVVVVAAAAAAAAAAAVIVFAPNLSLASAAGANHSGASQRRPFL